MGTITVGRENSTSIDLSYEDHGAGPPVVLIHGFPLNRSSWEKQVAALLEEGHRVIVYDRRGFGGSSRPTFGYDCDTFAGDLYALLSTLDLQQVALVGHSLGTGEVVRYLKTYGSKRVRRAILIAPLQPWLASTAQGVRGFGGPSFERKKAEMAGDRYAFLERLIAEYYDANVDLGTRVSEQVLRQSWADAVSMAPRALVDCAAAFLTDFREDLKHLDVPLLVVSGGQDRLAPFEVAGQQLATLLPEAKVLMLNDAPHGLLWTHAEELNAALLAFLDG
jgi:non-heme chloroperoxidase